KSIFAEDILSLRKRLVEYSKINVGGDRDIDEKTTSSSTQTNSLVLTQTGPQGLSLSSSNVNVTPPVSIGSSEKSSSDVVPPPPPGGTGKVVLDEAVITAESKRKIDVKAQVEYQLEETDGSSYGRNTSSRVMRYSQARYQPPKEKPSIKVSTLIL